MEKKAPFTWNKGYLIEDDKLTAPTQLSERKMIDRIFNYQVSKFVNGGWILKKKREELQQLQREKEEEKIGERKPCHAYIAFKVKLPF